MLSMQSDFDALILVECIPEIIARVARSAV
jgi:hypothetical protein